ncbi:polypeptide-transport-associated domain protein FtsQ-type [Clostridium sp. CAG:440]|nr:polypeptide-transport-associated domain protein FtsQ-type [Clostridium sp. CAG:440]HJJ15144.1 FtsQ-type POTRA domain-containing protein [Clostridiaceae bacterium]
MSKIQAKHEEKNIKQKQRQREKRIKEMKKNEETEFDFDTETVINMTNKNNKNFMKKNNAAISKNQRKIAKKKKRVKRIIKWTSLALIIIAGAIFAFASPLFNITQIEVINTNLLSKDKVISLSGIKKDQNIFRFLKSDVIKKIKEDPYVQDVKINRQLPNKVQIDIEERQRNFSLEFLNGYAYINNQGYILEISQDKLNLPVIKGASTEENNITPGKRLEQKDLEKLEVAIKIMTIAKENELDEKVTSIDISNKNEYILYLESEKKTVYLGNQENLTTKMLYTKKIIEKESGNEGTIYVNGDFTNKFKAYFRQKV